ncbi:MAG: pantoate--beta-alanine ligase [Longimicrobiales bacterium]
MNRVDTGDALRGAVAAARSAGRRIGLVPTMGHVHEGHLSLVDRALEASDFVVVTVFVNPLQFGPGEDFARYPRDPERDTQLFAARGAHLLFAPSEVEMYPTGEPAVFVVAPALADRLCGAFRPGLFQGVLTVVAKLFNRVTPDVAVFGRKDFQQLVLIRRMVRDLDFTIEILEGDVVREPDGLALSSRNGYLDAEARGQAALLRRSLLAAQESFDKGETSAAALIASARYVLELGPLVRPQYIELVDAVTLDPVARARPGNVLAVAAHVGKTRLIDNHVLAAPRRGFETDARG